MSSGLPQPPKVLREPTIGTTVLEARGAVDKGHLERLSRSKPLNRSFINAWEDKRIVEAVKKTGRKKLGIAALWTEVCREMAVFRRKAMAMGPCRDGRLRRRVHRSA
jgi:hypothetical protein